jgi:putative membrane protein
MRAFVRILTMALLLAPAVLATEPRNPEAKPRAQVETTKTPEAVDTSVKSAPAVVSDESGRFFALIHKVNLFEIDAGKLALKQGLSGDVKDYGKMLVVDHTKADDDLGLAAKNSGVDLKAVVLFPEDQAKLLVSQKKIDELAKMNGSQFDKAFGLLMANDHRDVIGLLREHKDKIKSADLRNFIDKALPTLESHRDIAERISRGERAAMLDVQNVEKK